MDPASRLYIPYFHTSTLAVKHLIWFVGYGIKKHVSMLHVSTDLQTNLGVQELQGLNCVEPAYAQDAWRKLVEDQQLKVRAGATMESLSCKLTRLLQDLIQSILDTVGCSPDSLQPANVLEGMVRFEATLLHHSRSSSLFVEYPPERGPRNGEKDGRSCDLQHAQALDV